MVLTTNEIVEVMAVADTEVPQPDAEGVSQSPPRAPRQTAQEARVVHVEGRSGAVRVASLVRTHGTLVFGGIRGYGHPW